MLGRILPVIRKEFIHIFRDPRTLAVMFVAPLMQLILLGYAATTDVRNVPLAVLDGSDPSVASSSLSAARLVGQAAATEVQQRTLARRGASLSGSAPIDVRTRVWYNPDMDSAVFMIPGLIGLVLQLQATLLTSSAIVRERERGTIEQLIVTPIRPFELIVGKILPYALVALMIMAEVLLAGTFWFGVPIKGSTALLLAISCLFLLSTLGIGLLISTVANTQQEAFLLTFLTLLPSVFLSGFIYPIAAMPAVLRAASGVIPLTYFLVVVRGIVIKGVDAATLMPQIGALAVFGAALIALASLRFRKRLD
jgi:ABC-2 type transport system permease protein